MGSKLCYQLWQYRGSDYWRVSQAYAYANNTYAAQYQPICNVGGCPSGSYKVAIVVDMVLALARCLLIYDFHAFMWEDGICCWWRSETQAIDENLRGFEESNYD
jgi:hypothetical protein